MNKKLVFSEYAMNDILETYQWYELQNEKLGDKFILELEKKIEEIKLYPYRCAKIYKTTRRTFLYIYSYAVFYSVHREEILIRRVLHTSRNPKEWEK